MLDKFKQYWETIVTVLLFIMTGAFLYEKSRRGSAEAIADNKEVLDKLAEGDKQKASNDGKLEAEESKREEIRKESEDAKHDDSDDPSTFLKQR